MSIKIEVLQIRNFKRVTLAEVSFGPDGLTVIGGANGQGKSTFLSAIQALLGGAKYMPSQPHNLEAGGATAVIRAKLSNGIEVERSGKSSTLKVVVDGQKGNQSTLNEFLNEFALDINRFMRGTDKERADLLIKHIGIGEKLEALIVREKKLYDERTLVSRDAKRKKQLADALPTYAQAPVERLDMRELIQRERELAAENAAHAAKSDKMASIRDAGISKRAEIEELQQKIDAAKSELEKLSSDYLAIKSEVSAFVPHDLTALESQINNAEAINKMVEANLTASAAEKEAAAIVKEEQDLTDAINEAREQRTKLTESIVMPLPELQIVEGDMMYRGQKWDCMSGSERLKVSTAISRAFKPECGFVLIDELEQLDWATLSEFDSWARDNGIQIIGAMVCDDEKAGDNVIIIEDGRVKA
jgi:chromosome segregation ATPase